MIPLPDINQGVGVRIPDWNAELRSRVEDWEEGRLSLALPSDGTTDYDVPRGTLVEVEWIAARGMCRVNGTVLRRTEMPAPAILIELDGEPEVIQRRDYVRVNAVIDVTFKHEQQAASHGVTIDISGGGLRAKMDGLEIDVNEVVRVTLRLPDDDPVEAEARVCRRPEPTVYSMEFQQIERRDQERVIRYVFQRMRQAKAAA